MIKRISLKDFQSHALTSIPLSPGVTAVVGDSSTGKTALIRALRLAFFNQPRGTSFVRRSKSVCEITVELDDCVVKRIKGPDINQYLLGSEKWEDFGYNIPEKITNATRIRDIFIDEDKSFNLQFSYQLEGPFLLNESSPIKAKFLNRLSGAYIVDIALRQILSDSRSDTAKTKALNSEVAHLSKELDKYQFLPSAEHALQYVEKKLEEQQLVQDRLVELSSLQVKLKSWQKKYNRIQKVKKLYSHINIKKTQGVLDKLAVLKSLQQRHLNVETRLNSLRQNSAALLQKKTLTEQQHQEALSKLGVCPLCGTAIDKRDTCNQNK
jgi:DNA repair protein SbcC/Rad50